MEYQSSQIQPSQPDTRPSDIRIEEWRAIPGFIDRYEVSSRGQVRAWRVLKSKGGAREARRMRGSTSRGYRTVNLQDSWGNRRTLFVHKAVLLAFVGPRPLGHECRHLNGVRDDNRVENLAWGTPRENCEDKRAHGTLPEGTDVSGSKLLRTDVIAIRHLLEMGHGLSFVASLFACSRQHVASIQAGQSWRSMELRLVEVAPWPPRSLEAAP